MEILTWVLHGSLVHQDSEDNSEVIYPDLAHRLSAGIGPTRCGSRPASGIQPGYGQHGLDNRLRGGGLVPVASGLAEHDRDAAIRINNCDAASSAARLDISWSGGGGRGAIVVAAVGLPPSSEPAGSLTEVLRKSGSSIAARQR